MKVIWPRKDERREFELRLRFLSGRNVPCFRHAPACCLSYEPLPFDWETLRPAEGFRSDSGSISIVPQDCSTKSQTMECLLRHTFVRFPTVRRCTGSQVVLPVELPKVGKYAFDALRIVFRLPETPRRACMRGKEGPSVEKCPKCLPFIRLRIMTPVSGSENVRETGCGVQITRVS